jgi:hypothetical protein
MRPRRFETWQAAIYFALFVSTGRRRKARVRRAAGLGGLPVWEVTLP